MPDTALFLILLGAPLLGALFNGAWFKSHNAIVAGTVASGALLISFMTACYLVMKLAGLPVASRAIQVNFYNWISVGGFHASAGFVLDPISAVMILIITGVGSLIHIYSIGYMAHDKRPAKYFSYLNYFIFNMLLLVLGANLLIMFVGWEGVGLCSYLLIGFWFDDEQKAAAGMKAFITNRIGDAGFLLGIFLLYKTFGTVNFAQLSHLMPTFPEVGWFGPITLACLFLFIGATGKSAQIPLYVWLPDAMAGPTPVSALIHAATMVTAGVYMIVRLNHVFLMAPNAMLVVATVGAVTALYASTIAVTQWDIKKVLAYSTISQLGYMFLGAGVGAFSAGLFHVMTHAFFKALLFLGAGSIIHALDGEQDMRKMGGLAKKMPITYVTFLCAYLAIIGLPPFAGFFSKDSILGYAYSYPHGGVILWFLGLLGAIFTAFYMTRMMALVFWGKSRVSEKVHAHESPAVMALPLVVLGVLSVVGGWVGMPDSIRKLLPGHIPNLFNDWLRPAVAMGTFAAKSPALEWSLMGLSTALVLASAIFAYVVYIKKPELAPKMAEEAGPVYDVVLNKYYVDEIYFGRIINPIIDLAKGLWAYIDVNFIDKLTYLVADWVESASNGLSSIQTGNLQQYALYIALGLVVIILTVVVI